MKELVFHTIIRLRIVPDSPIVSGLEVVCCMDLNDDEVLLISERWRNSYNSEWYTCPPSWKKDAIFNKSDLEDIRHYTKHYIEDQ